MSQTPIPQKKVNPQSMALIAESARIRSWELITSDPLAVVLADGYFDPLAGSLDVLDRIDVTAGYRTESAQTALLVVTGIVVKESRRNLTPFELSLPADELPPRFEHKVRRVRTRDYVPEGTPKPEELRRLGSQVGVVIALHGAMATATAVLRDAT